VQSQWRTRSWTLRLSRSSFKRGLRLLARPVLSVTQSPSHARRPKSLLLPTATSLNGNFFFFLFTLLYILELGFGLNCNIGRVHYLWVFPNLYSTSGLSVLERIYVYCVFLTFQLIPGTSSTWLRSIWRSTMCVTGSEWLLLTKIEAFMNWGTSISLRMKERKKISHVGLFIWEPFYPSEWLIIFWLELCLH